MNKLFTTVAAALLAAGCSWQAAPKEADNAASNGVDYRQRVADMSEPQRKSMLLRAIVGASLPCQAIETATQGTDSTGAPAWIVHCTDGHDRTVAIAPNGSARILDADPPTAAAPGNTQ